MTLITRILQQIREARNEKYLLDFKTGNILDYDVQSIEILLMADPELHDEFEAEKTKKQKQMKFLYLRYDILFFRLAGLSPNPSPGVGGALFQDKCLNYRLEVWD